MSTRARCGIWHGYGLLASSECRRSARQLEQASLEAVAHLALAFALAPSLLRGCALHPHPESPALPCAHPGPARRASCRSRRMRARGRLGLGTRSKGLPRRYSREWDPRACRPGLLLATRSRCLCRVVSWRFGPASPACEARGKSHLVRIVGWVADRSLACGTM
jgi:hypothetical protein